MMRALLQWLSPGASDGRLAVLIFHRVRPEIDPLFPGEPDAQRFESQLQWVRNWFNVISLDVAVTRLRDRTLPPRALAITFDDGYADNCTVALPILERLGMSATFFIATGFLDGGRMWNDTVIEAVRHSPHARLQLREFDLGDHDLSDDAGRRASIERLLPALKYLPFGLRAQRVEAILARSGATLPDDLMLSTGQLQRMHAAGMTIGAHTVNHPILTRLPDAEARSEILQSRATLEAKLDAPVRLFAYPNGRPGADYGPAHVRMARELGFAAAVTTSPGVASVDTDSFQIPRFTPWDQSRIRYGLRMAGNLRAAPEMALEP